MNTSHLFPRGTSVQLSRYDDPPLTGTVLYSDSYGLGLFSDEVSMLIPWAALSAVEVVAVPS